ncbi:MAG TPA: hypothetical protein DCS43_11620 [Verrucomicrobia bacterium]|nr:hypothetical protein [Verrucomicrobiota bacterium]
MQFKHRAGRQASGTAGKVFTSIFGLVFGSIGLSFAIVVLVGLRQTVQMKSWVVSDCVIEAAEVHDADEDYQFTVRYRYEYEGSRYIGTRYTSTDDYRFESIATKQELLTAYDPGTTARCFVNPDNPSQAVLKRETSLLPGVGSVLFASIFVIIGYGMIVVTWWPRRPPVTQATTETGGTAGRRIGLLFCSVFILIGLVIPYFAFVKPLQRQRAARRWIPVEAEVLKSAVRSHRGDDSTTYSVYIAYRYEIDGIPYEGDRYRFSSSSSSGHAEKAEIVRQHPVGSRITVYVDPADSAESVVQREAGASLYLGLIPVVFAVFGFLFLIIMLRAAPASTAGHTAGGTMTRQRNRAKEKIPPAVRRSGSRVGAFFLMLFISIFWNGIVSVFLMSTIKEWQSDQRPVFSTLFLTPFVLAGLGLIGAAFHFLLKIFSPVAELEPMTDSLSLGKSSVLRFRIRGNVQRITQLTITLTAREEATYSRGTNTYTDRHVFLEQTRLKTMDPKQMASGEITVNIPPGTMHSFEAPHNKIVWSLKVSGTISHWPDLNDEFILNVNPREVQS